MTQPQAPDKSWIEATIRSFCTSPENSLHNEAGEQAWGEPLVGYASGNDPLFSQIKEDIGPFYWTPLEAFRQGHLDIQVEASQLTVISYILPQTEATRLEQRQATEVPSERWARSRFYGEHFNCALRLHLAEQLTHAGYPAVAPERLNDFAYQKSERFGIASNWSERHTAWIAGHGTFGLSDGLITPVGKAVRFGSVVAKSTCPPRRALMLAIRIGASGMRRGTCGACMRRCPVDAITEEGHDKTACFKYIRKVTAPYVREHYGTGDTPCGLCQVKIPCEAKVPF